MTVEINLIIYVYINSERMKGKKISRKIYKFNFLLTDLLYGKEIKIINQFSIDFIYNLILLFSSL